MSGIIALSSGAASAAGYDMAATVTELLDMMGEAVGILRIFPINFFVVGGLVILGMKMFKAAKKIMA